MIVRPEAEADLVEAREWYDRQSDGLGADFLLCVEEVFQQIDRMPAIHQVVYQDVRKALTRRFPYVVYYRVEGEDVIVFAVLHCRRDAHHWKSRV